MKKLAAGLLFCLFATPAYGQTIIDPAAVPLADVPNLKLRFDHPGTNATHFKTCIQKVADPSPPEVCSLTTGLPPVLEGTITTREVPFPSITIAGGYTLSLYAVGPGGTSPPLNQPINVIAPVPTSPTGLTIIKITVVNPSGGVVSETEFRFPGMMEIVK